MLRWDELALQNKKMTMWNLIRFLKDSKVIGGSLSVEAIEDIISKVLTISHKKEHDFWSSGKIVNKIYEDINEDKQEVKFDGDPMIQFSEFQIILGRVAIEISLK